MHLWNHWHMKRMEGRDANRKLTSCRTPHPCCFKCNPKWFISILWFPWGKAGSNLTCPILQLILGQIRVALNLKIPAVQLDNCSIFYMAQDLRHRLICVTLAAEGPEYQPQKVKTNQITHQLSDRLPSFHTHLRPSIKFSSSILTSYYWCIQVSGRQSKAIRRWIQNIFAFPGISPVVKDKQRESLNYA